jgi:hypothetical protein
MAIEQVQSEQVAYGVNVIDVRVTDDEGEHMVYEVICEVCEEEAHLTNRREAIELAEQHRCPE